ncbi:MAG: HlyD family secretion protein [Clostridia bacterium]|nr:HlyD family secretion protein [Clostridia bacterium]
MPLTKLRINRGWLILLCLSLVLVLGGVFFFMRSKDSKAAAQTNNFSIVAVRRGPIVVNASGTGTVRAAAREEVRSQAAGELSRLYVAKGDKVKAGQVVAELDNENLLLSMERNRLELDRRRQELKQLLEDKQGLEIRAPVGGRLTGFDLRRGQYLGNNALLGTIVDNQAFELVVGLNKAQLPYVKEGDEVEVFLPDYLNSVKGTIKKIDRAGRGTGAGLRYDVTVGLSNPGALTEGLRATITFAAPGGTQTAAWEGTLTRPKGVEVRAGVGGEVEEVLVENNSMVEAGQVLARIKSEDLDNQIVNKELQIRQLELDIASQQKQLADTAVKAPIDGTVIDDPLKLGEEVKVGTLICTIADFSQMEVVVPIDELDIPMVKIGQEADIRAEALQGKIFQGEVVEIAEEGKSQGGVTTYDVTLRIASPEGLKAGMTVNVDIKVAAKNDALLLPVEAVQSQGGRWFVFLPPDTSEQGGRNKTGQLRRQEIKVGLHNERDIEVLEGLKEGDRVVIPRLAGQSTSSFRPPGAGFGGMGIPGSYIPGTRPTQRR